MTENKHQPWELKQMQSLPLEAKIIMTKERVRQWYEYWEGQVYVSFSGGKDSTVLKHIVDSMYYDVPSVFVNTGLEYPEIQKFVRDVKAGKYECFNPNVEIVRPETRFDEVIKTYGYPAISKAVSHSVDIARRNPNGNVAKNIFSDDRTGRFAFAKWKPLIDAPFCMSDKCCYLMKKKPALQYAKETKRKPMLATMACESSLRYASWIKTGCNAFDSKRPASTPLAFWTEQDIWHYLKKYNVPYCSVYGDIIFEDDDGNQHDPQPENLSILESFPKLRNTGCDRTGCIFCMFGCHLEKEPNRFQRLKETHPRQYKYCIGGGEYNAEGKWQPSKEGLGLGKVLDYIGVKY